MTKSFSCWLLLQVGDKSQHQGHEGYDDVIAEKYSWDSSVNRHSKIEIGDIAVIWNKEYLLGFGVFSKITTSSESKILYKCPKCLRTKGKRRHTKTPEWRCQASDCRFEYSDPIVETKKVISYTGYFQNLWFPFSKGLDAAELRGITEFPKDQNSIRPVIFDRLNELLTNLGKKELIQKVIDSASEIRP